MYTSYIGKKFLNYYNEKEGKNYSAKEFFNEVIFPLFFNDEKHFFNVANSSFFQSVPKKIIDKGVDKHLFKLTRFHKDIQNGASLTTLVGYAAQKVTAGTSGQVSSLPIKISKNEMYASWIGAGLSVAMGGGYSILIDIPEIMFGLFTGWVYYRKYLNQTSKLKGNQIDVWNSYWIVHFLSENYDNKNPLNNFFISDPVVCKAEKWKKLGFVEYNTNSWIKIICALAKHYPQKILTINAFKFSDLNQTIGFINIFLPQIKKMYEFRDAVFINKEKSTLTDYQIEQLEPFFNFNIACKAGTIGLKAIEPKGLRKFLPSGSYKYSQGKELKVSENNYLTFLLYKLWVIAMLNRTELQELAEKLAKALLRNKIDNKTNNRGKTIGKQEVKNLLDSRNVKYFIENLTEIMINQNSNMELFKEVVKEVLKMTVDNFPLFITLIKFEYNYQKSLEK